MAVPVPFVTGEPVEWRAGVEPSPGRAPVAGRLRSSVLEARDPVAPQAVVMLRRGLCDAFWPWFDLPICAPSMNRSVALQGATQASERVRTNEQSDRDDRGRAL
jgi:hypothetical protein